MSWMTNTMRQETNAFALKILTRRTLFDELGLKFPAAMSSIQTDEKGAIT